MKKGYDFSKGRRGAVLHERGKTRITIFLDDAIIRHFKALSEQTGRGYQTLINEVLATRVATGDQEPLTAAMVRRIVRQELAAKRQD